MPSRFHTHETHIRKVHFATPKENFAFKKGECSCGEAYVGKTKRNVEIRWAEDEAVRGTFEPANHLSKYPTHTFF